MSVQQLFSMISEDSENIIHKYHHQMKMKDVMDELKTKSIYCYNCDCDKACLNHHKCVQCEEDMCDYCYAEELTYDSFCNNNCEAVCGDCRRFQDYIGEQSDDETSSQIAYAEEELWRDMYGNPGPFYY